MGNTTAPEDCATIAHMELKVLQGRIKKLLESDVQLDAYSRAHLNETADRISKVLEATMFQFP